MSASEPSRPARGRAGERRASILEALRATRHGLGIKDLAGLTGVFYALAYPLRRVPPLVIAGSGLALSFVLPDDGRPLAGRIAWMGQQDLLMPWLDLRANVMLGARLRGDTLPSERGRTSCRAMP